MQALTAKDRAGLLDDAFALSYAGKLDTSVALHLSISLVHEREYLPWSVAVSWFYTLDDLLSLTPHYGIYVVSEVSWPPRGDNIIKVVFDAPMH